MALKMCPVCSTVLDESQLVCPGCGYSFPQGTTQFKPVYVQPGVGSRPQAALKTASLKVIQGPQPGLLYTLKDQTLTIGRHPRCDVFLNDMTVSRKHAELIPYDGGFTLRDANSYNGTWVNNKSIEMANLVDGDIVQIGAFVLEYRYR